MRLKGCDRFKKRKQKISMKLARLDRISDLPEELLLRILSSLPAQDVVSTMVLSKRWQFLWKRVPSLEYDGTDKRIKYERFSKFVNSYLRLHKAPVLESVHFKLGGNSCAADIRLWTRTVLKRGVPKLIIESTGTSSSPTNSPARLFRSLYKCCGMLGTLKLSNVVLVNAPSSISFPSLKTLSLLSVKYPGDEFVKRFLSNCPRLEELHVEQCEEDNVTTFTVVLPYLKSLVLCTSDDRDVSDDGFVIDAPSLEYLDIFDECGGFCVIENDMPKIVTARFASYWDTEKILGSITSVKRLNLCSAISKDGYPDGSVFHRLEHLKTCTCSSEWLNTLMCLLRDSPNLQALKIELWEYHQYSFNDQARPCWNEPCSIPECLLSSLETLEWVNYEGAKEEKELLAFIIRNGSCLKKVTISYSEKINNKCHMINELSWWSRLSPSCQTIFK